MKFNLGLFLYNFVINNLRLIDHHGIFKKTFLYFIFISHLIGTCVNRSKSDFFEYLIRLTFSQLTHFTQIRFTLFHQCDTYISPSTKQFFQIFNKNTSNFIEINQNTLNDRTITTIPIKVNLIKTK